MTTRPAVQAPSPLDAYLAPFLNSLTAMPDGFSPTVDSASVAQQVEVLPDFVDALFVSARTRGLIEPFRAKNARGRFRWQVSHRGRVWLAARLASPPIPASLGEPPVASPPLDPAV